VDVTLVDLRAADDVLARAAADLAPEELARARRGTPAVHRHRVLLRAAVRTALAAALGATPAAVPLRTAPSGRLSVAVAVPLDVSCSGSAGLGVVAVGHDCRVGVDVELVAPGSPDVLAEGWLAPAERRALARLGPARRALAVTRCWTQKEAVLKGRGTGLTDELPSLLTPVGRRSGTVAGWRVRDVPVPAGWVASLAVAPLEESS